MESLLLVFPGVFYFVVSNNYFGWNGSPKSDSKLIVDGLVLVLVLMSTCTFTIVNALRKLKK